MKIFVWTVSIILGLIVVALAVVFFSPDYNLYFVRSESMAPAINMGDMIVTGPANGPFGGISPGAIVTYARGDELVTHRIVSLENSTLVTKGDAAEDPDPEPVEISRVMGVYLFKIPKLGYLSSFIHTNLGWFLTIILPATALVGFIVKVIIKEASKNENHGKKCLD